MSEEERFPSQYKFNMTTAYPPSFVGSGTTYPIISGAGSTSIGFTTKTVTTTTTTTSGAFPLTSNTIVGTGYPPINVPPMKEKIEGREVYRSANNILEFEFIEVAEMFGEEQDSVPEAVASGGDSWARSYLEASAA